MSYVEVCQKHGQHHGEICGECFEHLKEENSQFREALAVYADPEYWRAIQGDDEEYLFIESLGQKAYIQGKIARAALEKK